MIFRDKQTFENRDFLNDFSHLNKASQNLFIRHHISATKISEVDKIAPHAHIIFFKLKI